MAKCKFLPITKGLVLHYIFVHEDTVYSVRFDVIPHPMSVDVFAFDTRGRKFYSRHFTPSFLACLPTFFDMVAYHKQRCFEKGLSSSDLEYRISCTLVRTFINSLTSSELAAFISNCCTAR